MFVNLLVVKEQAQSLLADINRRTEIFVDSLGRHEKLFPEDVQRPIAANEPNKMITTRFWF